MPIHVISCARRPSTTRKCFVMSSKHDRHRRRAGGRWLPSIRGIDPMSLRSRQTSRGGMLERNQPAAALRVALSRRGGWQYEACRQRQHELKAASGRKLYACCRWHHAQHQTHRRRWHQHNALTWPAHARMRAKARHRNIAFMAFTSTCPSKPASIPCSKLCIDDQHRP